MVAGAVAGFDPVVGVDDVDCGLLLLLLLVVEVVPGELRGARSKVCRTRTRKEPENRQDDVRHSVRTGGVKIPHESGPIRCVYSNVVRLLPFGPFKISSPSPIPVAMGLPCGCCNQRQQWNPPLLPSSRNSPTF